MTKQQDSEFRVMSEAVQAWYRFYEAPPDDRASRVLRIAAIDLYYDGYKTAEDIAFVLIGTYVGICSTKINAPTSASVH
ncbi:hypothetical protein [Rhizobium sp. LjRoot258]|uniref:hypothetical protein n=1 Tax=Rhizobium sp. LjRoot258 TaxID=3342299 RepID=UPI003ECE3C80